MRKPFVSHSNVVLQNSTTVKQTVTRSETSVTGMPACISRSQLSPSCSRRSSVSTPAAKLESPMRPRHSRNSSTCSTPISPPARLHLRNILPLSPEEPAFMPPPPRAPKAWVWQCHQCLTVYPLGCTRRCLECAHTYCMSNPQSRKGIRSKKHQRRRQSGLCAAMFDYTGWEQWGSWRRKVLGLEAAGRCEPRARDRAFARNKHDCWIDCDSPSQCFQRRYELAVEAMRKQAYFLECDDEESDHTPSPDVPTALAVDAEDVRQADNEAGLKKTAAGEAWWVSRPGPEDVDEEPRVDESFYDVDDEDDGSDTQACPVKQLTVRNLAAQDAVEYSDSDSESDASDWSSLSSESESSLVGARVSANF
ncbi:hypothetical protein F4861DRAFT_16223 [Xylaria intraflava]|nr:hypothetical protein F4861DRAFT_16223 [Xylaria intraflava]